MVSINYFCYFNILEKVFNNYKTHLNQIKRIVPNTKKNFSLKFYA